MPLMIAERVAISRQLIRDWSPTIPVMEKTVAVVAIKSVLDEVKPRLQALWDRGFIVLMITNI